MNFTKNTLETSIKNLASKGKIYSNESQFQFDLAWELRKQGFDVELEMLSVSQSYVKKLSKEERKKAYTDIVIKDGTDYIAIELKYKTPETDDIMCYVANNEKVYLFPQGADNIGAYLYWKNIERLEMLVNGMIPLNFDANKKVIKGYAVLLTNDKKYWDNKKHRNLPSSLAREFYPIDGRAVNGRLCYYVGVNSNGERVKGGWGAKRQDKIDTEEKAHKYYPKDKEAKEHYPVEIKGNYTCNWETYLNKLTCKLSNGKQEPKGDEFRYLILEINKLQGQTP